jgi:hypothetical protein
MISHGLEFLSKLNGLVERLLFLFHIRFDFLRPQLDGLLELRVAMLICIELHVLLSLNEGCDKLTAGLAHAI